MKKFVEIGYQIFHLTEKEIEFVQFLYKKNLLKFSPKIIDVYGFEKGVSECK